MKKLNTFLTAMMICLSLTLISFAQRRATPVNLNVTIDDLVSQTAGIRSDGLGTYLTGQDSVTAQLTEYGWFNFVSGTRVVNAIYSTPVEIGATLPVSMDSRTNVNIKTFVTSLKFQDMAIGQSQCVGAAVNINLNDTAQTVRTIGYRGGRGTITNTAYVYVTHPDANTWILEPTPQTNCGGTDNSLDNIARIRDAKTKGKTVPDTDYGRYLMPFRLTLTRR
ncbi:MAG: hypothetical protein M3367_17340 [Acidobacteriota bacterium]|nr:hypothetical protein [Acidobacteriota bacterium]